MTTWHNWHCGIFLGIAVGCHDVLYIYRQWSSPHEVKSRSPSEVDLDRFFQHARADRAA